MKRPELTPTPESIITGHDSPPKRIYLQWHGDGDRSDAAEVSVGDVTWCRDRIFKSDYEYKLVQKEGAQDPLT